MAGGDLDAGARHHLAQVNIALPVAPLESEQMAGFAALLESVNAAAERAPGFLWRLADDSGDATGYRVLDDDRLIVNMSLWESVEALRAFTFTDAEHLAALRRRREWFSRLKVSLALWWLPAGTLPTLEDAEQRLATVAEVGPTEEAFTLTTTFAPPAPQSAAQSPHE